MTVKVLLLPGTGLRDPNPAATLGIGYAHFARRRTPPQIDGHHVIHFVHMVGNTHRSEALVGDPDMPAPQNIPRSVAHGDQGVALLDIVPADGEDEIPERFRNPVDRRREGRKFRLDRHEAYVGIVPEHLGRSRNDARIILPGKARR